MGGYSANSANVNFDYDGALQAARDLYSLSGVVTSKHESRVTASADAEDTWVGGHRDSFDSKMSTEDTDVETISGALVTLANRLATAWSEARGEQDRINHARFVQDEKDNDSGWENAGEFFTGEDDYGAPPENPPAPVSPDYAIPSGYSPVHPEFENVSVSV